MEAKNYYVEETNRVVHYARIDKSIDIFIFEFDYLVGGGWLDDFRTSMKTTAFQYAIPSYD